MSTIIDSYSESNRDDNTYVSSSIKGQSFTGNGSILKSAQFLLTLVYPAYGDEDYYLEIYEHSGIYGTTGVPTGSPLATSDIVSTEDIDASWSFRTFNFSGSNQIVLENGVKYFLVIKTVNTPTSRNSIGLDSSSPTHPGNGAYNSGSSWTPASTWDFPFYVYGDELTPVVGQKYALPPFRGS